MTRIDKKRVGPLKLNYVKDPYMLLFIEKGIRGCISTITKRYAKANNKKCADSDRKKDISYITYLNANNLYGWAMSQYLLTGNFKWINNDINVMNISYENKKGYIIIRSRF